MLADLAEIVSPLPVPIADVANSKPVPSDILSKWQEIVDLLAEVTDCAGAYITRWTGEEIVFELASRNVENPAPTGTIVSWESGLLCRYVINSGKPLYIPNTQKDERIGDTPNGKLGLISYLGFPVEWPSGGIFGTISVLDSRERSFDDVAVRLLDRFRQAVNADLKVMEQIGMLQQAADREKQANEAKSRFLRAMGHEIRTPLNAIIGISELMTEEAAQDNNAMVLEPAERINQAGQHMLKLINGLLDLSKIEAGRVEINVEPFEISELFANLQDTVAPLAANNGNQLKISLPENDQTLNSDIFRIKQILLNLLSNASKFTQNGIITLSAEWVGDQVHFTVEDTGIGIAEEKLPQLFEEFYQGDQITPKYGGTGLGLAISKGLAQLLKGNINVESEPGSGSRFTLAVANQEANRPT